MGSARLRRIRFSWNGRTESGRHDSPRKRCGLDAAYRFPAGLGGGERRPAGEEQQNTFCRFTRPAEQVFGLDYRGRLVQQIGGIGCRWHPDDVGRAGSGRQKQTTQTKPTASLESEHPGQIERVMWMLELLYRNAFCREAT